MKSGLDDVIAAETQLSDVDGAAGRLIIRGVSLDDLIDFTPELRAGSPKKKLEQMFQG